ncbi:tetratricopeptide repeat protein [Plantactinospora sp. B6F1]|uniref:AfsR/SARP family transcriptional regulator n=1 Tax=Plantactinospora sp. B6F1 TaxID=3158971 RepID=UPI0010DA04FA
MRFSVLGPVVAHGADGPVILGPARQRTVLATLLVEPGVVVSPEQLVDRVWGERPPRRARETLHTYLSRLRTVLGEASGPVLVRQAHGYVLDVDPAAVDLHHFRILASGARSARDEEAVDLWSDALTLWRGTPFADVDSDWLRAVAAGLERERLAAMLDRNDVLLRRGEYARLIPELSAAVQAHPLDERLAGQLMLSLYAAGRQADALAQFRLLHGRLVDEVGSDPGPTLRELHERILRHDPTLGPTTAVGAAGPAAPLGAVPGSSAPPGERRSEPPRRAQRPAQLPADVTNFTGRTASLRRLDTLLAASTGDQAPNAVVIAAIGGTAGVGKTALAVHWAHRVADRFPDGQLYVNLRGYDPEQPMPAAEALACFLTALGVTGQDIPLNPKERAARYRSEVAGRRMLILLDNAATVAQVRMLLPGTGSCLVVVTSRDSLAGLVVVDGAHRLDLDLLAPAEAVGLLRRLVGARAEAEPVATAVLAEQCARLPLALRVAAELAVSRPHSTLAELAAELTDRRSRLDLLDAGGDPYAAVREVFSWSIQHLPPDAADTFRVLGLHPGADLDPYAVAALAGTDLDRTRRSLTALARAHLVHRTSRDRYGIHDLLRAYASGLATAELTDRQRLDAQRRLFDHYRNAAVSAMDVLHPAEAHHRPGRVASSAPVPDLAAAGSARSWLDRERFNLVAVAAHAAASGRSDYPVELARIVHRYLIDAHLTEAISLNGHAQRAAERVGDLGGEAHVLRQLGAAYTRMSRYELAVEHHQKALARFQRRGDLVGQALTLIGLGVARFHQGRNQDAIELLLRAITVSRRAGDRLGEALALNNLGVFEQRLGRYADAGEHQRRALARFREMGARAFEATALTNLGAIELRQGGYARAAEHLRESLAMLRELNTPIVEAHTLDTLGVLSLRLDDPGSGTAYFQQALELFRRIGVRGAQARSLNGLGEAALLAGRPAEALAQHAEALAIASETGTGHQAARAHTGIGHSHRALGDPDAARSHYERAHAIYTEFDMPEAADVRGHLGTLVRVGDGACPPRDATAGEPGG